MSRNRLIILPVRATLSQQKVATEVDLHVVSSQWQGISTVMSPEVKHPHCLNKKRPNIFRGETAWQVALLKGKATLLVSRPRFSAIGRG
jgi:hypothetical protein